MRVFRCVLDEGGQELLGGGVVVRFERLVRLGEEGGVWGGLRGRGVGGAGRELGVGLLGCYEKGKDECGGEKVREVVAM
jgi:hypothetical protein